MGDDVNKPAFKCSFVGFRDSLVVQVNDAFESLGAEVILSQVSNVALLSTSSEDDPSWTLWVINTAESEQVLSSFMASKRLPDAIIVSPSESKVVSASRASELLAMSSRLEIPVWAQGDSSAVSLALCCLQLFKVTNRFSGSQTASLPRTPSLSGTEPTPNRDREARLHFLRQSMIGTGEKMQAVFELVEKVSCYPTSVVIRGESGTGKELVARAIHQLSDRSTQPFIAINCGAIPENLIESELFGVSAGAFTDSTHDRVGLFEEAHGGTVFLDEVGEMPLAAQVKLLRVLQEREVVRVGEHVGRSVDVRLLAATNKNLERAVALGEFREDLYYRLQVVPIELPALRERLEDIEPLFEYFNAKYQSQRGHQSKSLSPKLIEALKKYDWPGNVREYENWVERTMVLSQAAILSTFDLTPTMKARASAPSPQEYEASSSSQRTEIVDENDLSLKKASRALEITMIQRALEHTDGNRTQAARLLEISPRSLLYKIKEYQLESVGK